MANALITRFGEMIDVKTTTPGEYVHGRWVDGVETVVPILAGVLPLALSEMATEVAAAGLETRDAIAIYTEYELKEADQKSKQDRDIVTWKGNDYVVKVVVPRYQIASLNHFKAIAILKGS